MIQGYSGRQPGDPVRAAAAIIKAVEAAEPPLHLLLGKVACDLVENKLKSFAADAQRFQELSLAADFPAEAS